MPTFPSSALNVAANFRGLKGFPTLYQSSSMKRPRREGSSSLGFVNLVNDEFHTERCGSSLVKESSLPPRVLGKGKTKVAVEGASDQVLDPQVNILFGC